MAGQPRSPEVKGSVLWARGLPNCETWSKSDPYCVATQTETASLDIGRALPPSSGLLAICRHVCFITLVMVCSLGPPQLGQAPLNPMCSQS